MNNFYTYGPQTLSNYYYCNINNLPYTVNECMGKKPQGEGINAFLESVAGPWTE